MRDVGNLLKEFLPDYLRQMENHPHIYFLQFMDIYQTITLSPSAFFFLIYKVLLENGNTHNLLIAHGGLYAVVAELSSCTESVWPMLGRKHFSLHFKIVLASLRIKLT